MGRGPLAKEAAANRMGSPFVERDAQQERTRSRSRSSAAGQRTGRIRVVYCIDNLQIGGTELNAVRTAAWLDRSRFDVSIICFREGGQLSARCVVGGVPIVRFPFRK